MERLSHELLLRIGSYLEQRDQHSLAIISWRLSYIGQSLLYKRPQVPPPQPTSRENQTFTFLRTILGNAFLASQVHALELYPRVRYSDVEDINDSRIVNIDPFVFRLCGAHQPGHLIRDDLIMTSEYTLIGAILRHLPNLRDLRIHTVTGKNGFIKRSIDAWGSEQDRDDILDEMFGLHAELQHVAGLKSLKKLRFCGPYFNHRWTELPHLEHLYIGMDTYAVSGGTPEPSFDKSINLECSTFIFDRCGFYEPMEAFLRGFNCLTHLSIYLLNYSYKWDSVLRVKTYPDEYGMEDDYDDILKTLSGVASTLQVLQILPKDGSYKGREKGKFKLFVNYPNPVSSWSTFTQLRHVKTPYRAFEVKLRETAANTEYFPSKLQMLELTCAIINPDHRFFLEFVLENRSQCPDLKTIHLHTFTYWNIRNDDGPRKKLIESWGDIWEKLEAAGVSLIVFDDDEDRDSDDEDEDEYEEYEYNEDEDED